MVVQRVLQQVLRQRLQSSMGHQRQEPGVHCRMLGYVIHDSSLHQFPKSSEKHKKWHHRWAEVCILHQNKSLWNQPKPSSFLSSFFFSSLSLVFMGHMTGLAWPIFIQWVKGSVVITLPTPMGSTRPLSWVQHVYLSITDCMSVSIATVVARVGDQWKQDMSFLVVTFTWQAFS